MKLRFLVLSLILFTGLSAAQGSNNTSIDASPGWVKADSPIYGWDIAFDNMLQTAGIVSAGDVAVERASEVAVAERRNNSEAAEKALGRFNSAAQEANNRDRERLQKAEQILTRVKERVPDQAQQGIKTALQNVERAKKRVPESHTVSSRKSNGGLFPDIKLPDVGNDREIESPGESGNTSPGREPTR